MECLLNKNRINAGGTSSREWDFDGFSRLRWRWIETRSFHGRVGSFLRNFFYQNGDLFMKVSEALQILGLNTNESTWDDIKAAYRKMATRYHPDINPLGLPMMQVINNAYETLEDYKDKGPFINEMMDIDIVPDLEEAIKAVIHLMDIKIEICGLWVWISGETAANKEALKGARYRWAPQKKMWYYRPEHQKGSKHKAPFSMDEIRAKFGSRVLDRKEGQGSFQRYLA